VPLIVESDQMPRVTLRDDCNLPEAIHRRPPPRRLRTVALPKHNDGGAGGAGAAGAPPLFGEPLTGRGPRRPRPARSSAYCGLSR